MMSGDWSLVVLACKLSKVESAVFVESAKPGEANVPAVVSS